MNRKLSDRHHRLNLISAIILLLGLVSALAIYSAAPDEPESYMGYTLIGGRMYPTVPLKTIAHNQELYGGKWFVLADDIGRWFHGLWYGKTLGVTIAWLSGIAAFMIFFFNNYVFFDDESEEI